MPRAVWARLKIRPRIQIETILIANEQQVTRNLIADTGAGSSRATVDLIMEELDCVLCGGVPSVSTALGGAYTGTFPVYNVRVQIPTLNFDGILRVVGVPNVPTGENHGPHVGKFPDASNLFGQPRR
jgi:hypothetical protein